MGKNKGKKDKSKGNGAAKEAPNLAAKFFGEVIAMDGVKDRGVSNGIGGWVGTTRVCKKAKSGFPADALLFPSSTAIHGLVQASKLKGVITDKNVAVVKITDKNYERLMTSMKDSIDAVKTKQADRKKKKAEAKKAETTGKKVTGKKAKRAAAAKEAQEKKPAPPPAATEAAAPAANAAAAASALTELVGE